MTTYAKFFAQVVATIISAVVAAMQNGSLSTAAWINVVIIGLSAVSVLGAGELPAGVWAHTRTYIAGASAAAVVIQSSLNGGISTATVLQAVIAALGAVGVLAVPGPVVQAGALKSGLLVKARHHGRHEEI